MQTVTPVFAVTLLTLAITATACASQPPQAEPHSDPALAQAAPMETTSPAPAASPVPELSVAETADSAQPPRNRTIYFDFNHDGPNAAADRLLAQHADFLQQHPLVRVQLHGHSDAQGDPLYNDHLAIQRALAIAERLEALGADPDQIEVFGWGSANPVDPTEAGRNRRVEFDYQTSNTLAEDDRAIADDDASIIAL